MPHTTVSRLATVVALGLLPALCACSRGLSDRAKLRRIGWMRFMSSPLLIGVPRISAEEALAAVEKGEPIVFVDVRTAAEGDVSIIPGAVALAQVEQQADAYKGKRLVAYCTIGFRSGMKTRRLRRKGLEAVNLKGGILCWTHAGGKLEHDGQEVRRLHVYGRMTNLAPDGIETVW